jgi:hypothetical protein
MEPSIDICQRWDIVDADGRRTPRENDLRRMAASRGTSIAVGGLLVLCFCAGVAHSDAPLPSSTWGGTTMGQGNALIVQGNGGLDIGGLVGLQLGYARALRSDLDLGIVAQGIAGIGWATGATARTRYHMLTCGNFHLALDVPISLHAYLDGDAPHLVIVGAEPGVMMSSWLGARVEVFYGAAFRAFHAPDTLFIGPQARAGVALTLGQFAIALGGNLSYLFITDTPAERELMGDLSVAFHFGT